VQLAVDKALRAADKLFGPGNHQLAVVDRVLQDVVGLLIDLDLAYQFAVATSEERPIPELPRLVSDIQRFRWPMPESTDNQPEAGQQPDASQEKAPGSSNYAGAESDS